MQKCICDNPGFCNYFQIEMTLNPPNWQWCQKASPIEREDYFDKISTCRRILIKSNSEKYTSVVNFFDKLPLKNNDVAICVIPSNDYAMELLNITRDNIIKYAAKCNADYIELSGDQNPDWPMANKYRVYQVSSKYEKTLYLDCDILIKDTAPNIFELTPNDKISAYEEYEIFSMPNSDNFDWARQSYKSIIENYLSNNNCFIKNGTIYFPDMMINGGVLVIPKSESHYYQQPQSPYPKDWCFDQQLLTILLYRDDKLFKLNEKWNFEFIRQDFWENNNSAHFIHFNAARPNSYRQTIIKRFKAGNNNKYTQFIDPSINAIQWLKPSSEKYLSIFKNVNDNPPQVKIDKNLIITVACGKEYEDILKSTGPIFKRYAEKCNADYIELTGTTQDIGHYEKFRIYPFVKKYNRTLFLDVDIVIKNNTPNIFDIVPSDSVGIHCDYELVRNNGLGEHHIKTFNDWKLNTAKSLLSKEDIEKYLKISEKKLFNSGVVICSKKHADIWRGVYKPCLKNFLVEQHIIEMRLLLNNYNITLLEDEWNIQAWMPNNMFFRKDIKKYFMHLAGWRKLEYKQEEIGSFFVGIPIEEMVRKTINEEIYIYS